MKLARAIELDDTQREILEKFKRSRCVPVRLAERAAIVLHAASGLNDQEIGNLMGITRQKAGRWRKRYAKLGLTGIEKDAPRPGRKRRIDEQTRAAVVYKTLQEKPEGQRRWNRTAMAKATGLSESTVGRIWKEHGLKPHLSEPSKRASFRIEHVKDMVGA
jgi:transposase